MSDKEFFSTLTKYNTHLAKLARETIDLIRSSGVTGELVEDSNGRWVNRPINIFTIKVQPRAENISFTLYGEPDIYNLDDFLRKDQNSYSRGWIKDSTDVKKFAGLAKDAHARRQQ